MLEVIDRGRVSESHPVPLLFVHGAWHAAWCWDEHFLSFFADRNYRALAVSLRGHGNSPTDKPLRACSVADFVEDISVVADTLPIAPVVIGHSMGGLIVQKYLESHDSPAGVLMTSMPPQGNLGSALRWIRRHPVHFTKMAITGKALPYISTPQLARERFFSAQTPDSHVVDYAARLQEDSSRVGIDCLVLGTSAATTLNTGGGDDVISVSYDAALVTGGAYDESVLGTGGLFDLHSKAANPAVIAGTLDKVLGALTIAAGTGFNTLIEPCMI